MAAAAIAIVWSEESPTDEDAEAGATWMRRDLHEICDPRVCRGPKPRAVLARYTGGPSGSHASASRASV